MHFTALPHLKRNSVYLCLLLLSLSAILVPWILLLVLIYIYVLLSACLLYCLFAQWVCYLFVLYVLHIWHIIQVNTWLDKHCMDSISSKSLISSRYPHIMLYLSPLFKLFLKHVSKEVERVDFLFFFNETCSFKSFGFPVVQIQF